MFVFVAVCFFLFLKPLKKKKFLDYVCAHSTSASRANVVVLRNQEVMMPIDETQPLQYFEFSMGEKLTIRDGSTPWEGTVVIKTLARETFPIACRSGDTVGQLLERVACSTPLENRQLVLQGRALESDRALSAYKIQNGMTLHLVFRQTRRESNVKSPLIILK